MEVGFEDVLNSKALIGRSFEVYVHIALWVDDRSFAFRPY
jgi:hypothetical protein